MTNGRVIKVNDATFETFKKIKERFNASSFQELMAEIATILEPFWSDEYRNTEAALKEVAKYLVASKQYGIKSPVRRADIVKFALKNLIAATMVAQQQQPAPTQSANIAENVDMEKVTEEAKPEGSKVEVSESEENTESEDKEVFL